MQVHTLTQPPAVAARHGFRGQPWRGACDRLRAGMGSPATRGALNQASWALSFHPTSKKERGLATHRIQANLAAPSLLFSVFWPGPLEQITLHVQKPCGHLCDSSPPIQACINICLFL